MNGKGEKNEADKLGNKNKKKKSLWIPATKAPLETAIRYNHV